ncbi:MerR family transcriptional regulator [Desulfoluna spongiiphila]|uniref:DNA-binding transcriptional regulator, MerR family n=1 Tax=Desulfoluna spongiiphila TaxID=419481 RepID=A0A1G5HGC7_9BACT|nr:MerR family transcriptional regulator [Desulfoluna spongiiphila]SCY62925.1 DNA-binding transcriptional regulator, MerR family [Desulfoluna spongiiphila]
MYTVSDVTKKLGISRSTLLYYERGGLVVPERDPVNGYRLYSQGILDRLVMLKQLQKAGFSLAECRHFMDGDPDMALVRERLVHLEKELVEMTVARDLLRSLYHRITGDAPPEMAPADAREWHAEFEKRSADAHAAWLRKMGFSEKEALYIRWVSRDMHDNATYVNHFFHVFEQMKRQGPGSTEATLKAFGSICHPEAIRSILDIGCGSGSASLVLAAACGAHITAVDNHQPFLDRLQEEVTRRGLEDRITPLNMSMHSLDFPENHFDLLWAEGSAYIVGVEEALSLWRPLIRDGGYLFLSDAVWLTRKPSKACQDYWRIEYPRMTDPDTRKKQAETLGYEVVDTFILPRRDWQDFYSDMKASVKKTIETFGMSRALREMTDEILLDETHGDEYGYVCLLLQKNK